MGTEIENFIKTLANFKLKNSNNVFNPWNEKDTDDYDNPKAAEIRFENLKKYLISKKGAKILLIGEAPGFNGCRFSGVPFKDEDTLLSEKDKDYKQSSNKKGPYKESSSTTFREQEILKNNDTKWVAWNIFPFHPYKDGQKNKNRKPTTKEIEACDKITNEFINLFKPCEIYAIGRVAEKYLKKLIESKKKEGKQWEFKCYIRHPARGGKEDFEKGINKIFAKD